MLVKVPISIDVNGLVAELNLSPTQTINLKNKMYYFLSCVAADNDNYRLNADNGGYRNICSVLMKKIIGNREYYTILELLTSAADPIIETNMSWHHPAKATKKGYCKGYRLTEKYNTGEMVYKTLPLKFWKKVKEIAEDDIEDMDINGRYQFLIDQFDKHQLTMAPPVYDFISAFAAALLMRVHDDNPYQLKMIYNHIGRWMYYINRIEQNDLWKNVSLDNHRLNSSITNIPKILRPYLRCNNEQLVMIDISSSQPYILSSVMNNKFFTATTDGYNLYTIYPELFNELLDNGYINIDNLKYRSNNNFKYKSSSTYFNSIYYYFSTYCSSTSYSDNTVTGSSSFMWCKFFTKEEIRSINHYQHAPFQNDYYTHVIEMYFKKTKQPLQEDLMQLRQQFKKSNMYVLFEDNYNHRNHNPNIQMFSRVFPGVDRWIEQAHKVIGKSRFAYLLQRAESYLLLNIICREFHQQFPAAPIFTIHDGLYTYDQYIPDLTSLVLRRCREITGVEVGIKTKCDQIVLEPQIEDIDMVWEEIRNVTTEKAYDKVRGRVFSSNVERGADFLKKMAGLRKGY